MMQPGSTATSPRGADLLTIGFAATVVSWALLYVAAMPPGRPELRSAALVGLPLCLIAAGWLAGRLAGRGAAGGAVLGALIGGIHLLVLLGLIGAEWRNPAAALGWIAAFFAAAVGLGAAGSALGRRSAPPSVNWTSALAWVTAATALLLVVAGGIVTGREAGLAVEGWMIAEGHFLLLFPVTLMQRDADTFAEHAHRLWGLLTGLTTIVLAVHVWLADPRRWLRWLTVAIVLAVTGQGVLGAIRVLRESVAAGIVHGVSAQVILAALATVAMVTMAAWRDDRPRTRRPTVSTDRTLTLLLLAALLLQITLGTAFRHLQPEPGVPSGALTGLLHGHAFVGSLLVLLLVLWCGTRAWGLYGDEPAVKRSGKMLVHTVVLQVLLGVGAFIVVPKQGPRPEGESIPLLEIALTTAHQVIGAVLLTVAVSLALWQRRRLASEGA